MSSAAAVVRRASSRRRPTLSFADVPFVLALSFIVGSAVLALVAPLLGGLDPVSQDLDRRLVPPVWAGGDITQVLGTDHLGRDTLSRLAYGGRISLLVGVSAVLGAGLLGLLVGIVSGYVGGRFDTAVQSIAYAQLSMPFVLLAIGAVATFGPSLQNIVLVLIVSGWVVFARVVRGLVISIKHFEFIEAAHMIGASHVRILLRHVLPHVANAFVVVAALQVGRMILMESALSFLGLGVQPPTPTWGGMLSDARNYLYAEPWLSILPGLAIVLMVLSVNTWGSWLRDRLDPRSREQ